MTVELKDTHLMEWLKDGYTHCQYGSKDWCQSYLNSAHGYIESLEAELIKANERVATLATSLSKAREVQTTNVSKIARLLRLADDNGLGDAARAALSHKEG